MAACDGADGGGPNTTGTGGAADGRPKTAGKAFDAASQSREATDNAPDAASQSPEPAGQGYRAANRAVDAPPKPKLRIYVPANQAEFPDGLDVNRNEVAAWITQKTGYPIEWEIQPKENVRQRLNTLIASGEAHDLIVTIDKSLFADYARQGLLAPLDGLLGDADSPIRRNVPQEAWASVRYDGTAYAIPLPQNMEASSGLFVRKDWLDKLGLERPATLDDYYAVLKAFKERAPGGPGTVPLVATAADGGGNAFGFLGAFAGAFGLGAPYMVKEGKVVYTRVEPEAKAYLAFMNRLYAEGLLDKDYPVNKFPHLVDKLVEGRAGMTTMGWSTAGTIAEALGRKDPRADIGFIDPPVGDGGVSGVERNAPVKLFMMIPASSPYAREAVDFLNRYMTPEVLDVVSYGWEGRHYEKKGGTILAKEESARLAYRIYYTLWDTAADFLNRVRLKGASAYYDPIAKDARFDNVLNLAPPIAVVETNNAVLSAMTNDAYVKMITGALPLSAFEDYAQRWSDSGGAETLAALNRWYESASPFLRP